MTNPLLNEKLIANQQRLARNKYLGLLPPLLREYLSQCEFIQPPKFDSIISKFWIINEDSSKETDKPEGFSYREFSRPSELIKATKDYDERYDQYDAYFYPFEDNPIYCVEFGWVRNNISELFDIKIEGFIAGYGKTSYKSEKIGLITRDYTAGIFIDNYCGYLYDDPNPDEVVYELATWGF